MFGPRPIVDHYISYDRSQRTRGISFDPKFFKSTRSYSRLLCSKHFYQRFSRYEYILIVQLDALLLKSDIASWCDKQYSYIGAPWFEGFSNPTSPLKLAGVGNGGFSLRYVDHCLRVFDRIRYLPSYRSTRLIHGHKKISSMLNDLIAISNFYPLIYPVEDVFWGAVVPDNLPWFKVPSPTVAAHFSFEVAPRYLFQLNKGQLPLGCHAWERYDADFWNEVLGAEFFDSLGNQNELNFKNRLVDRQP
ncbi:hypothetical protein N9J36_02800 [Litoricola sp.]|nr:hypothetical protein [Litorivicinus sp.]